MKSRFVLFIAFSILMWACQKKQVIISGKIFGDDIAKIDYTIPVNGIFNGLMTDSVIPDTAGNFRIEIPFEEQGFILLRPFYKTSPIVRNEGIIIAEPGENYQVVFDLTKDKDNFRVEGKYKNAMNEYNKLHKSILLNFGPEVGYFRKDSVASSIQDKTTNQREKEIAIFQDLFNKGEIPHDFLRLVQTDRYLYYSSLVAMVIWSKFEVWKGNPGYTFTPEQALVYKYKDEMQEVWKNAFLIPDSLQENIKKSPWWSPFYKNYISYKLLANNELTSALSNEYSESKTLNTFYINNGAKKYLPGDLFETYFANYIFEECFLGDNDNYELVTLYDQFVSEFPNNSYTRFLEPYIAKNRDFNKKIAESGFSGKVKFIDNYQEINSLADCVKPFEGKKMYIDVWASWCSSCRAEFSKKVQLDSILTSQGIDMLYISMDEDKYDKNWKDLIKYYDLGGYHVRANQQFAEDLKKIQNFKGGGTYYVPWHIMVDESGSITDLPAEIVDLLK